MDGQPDQRPDAQPVQPVHPDEAVAFSIRMGSGQPAQPQMPAPNAPPPLTPYPQTPPSAPIQGSPASPIASSNPGPQYATGYGQTSIPPLPPAPAGQPGVSPIVARLPERTRGPLGRPFPLPISLLIVVGCVVLLAFIFAVRVLALGGDWADGASAVGTVALVLAAVTALAMLLRLAAGRRSVGFVVASLLLLVALAVTGGVGLIGSAPLHQVQAKAMESSGQWGLAIHEYGLTGQKGPHAPDIARVQNAWGEQLLQQQNYQDALPHFQTVLDDYAQSGAEVARAQKGEFLSYTAWLKNDPTHVPYRDAIATFVNYAASANCASDCKTTMATVAPQAYYLYAVQLLTQKRYELAITEFGKLATQYGSSTYATQAHGQAATAYLAYGKQQISSQDCSGAVSSYRTLVANYKDTPEAATAQTALNSPQDVTGFISKVATNPTPTAHLSKHMDANAFYFSDEYSTSINPTTGAFTFKLVAQGTYYISTSRPVTGGTEFTWWYADATDTTYFPVNVTPLCTVQLGTLP